MFNSNIYGESWCRTVFANRNQAYGAYDLRKTSERNVLAGFFITAALVVCASTLVAFKGHGPTGNLLPPTIDDTITIQTDALPDDPIVETLKPETNDGPAPETDIVEPPTASAEIPDASIKIVKDVKEDAPQLHIQDAPAIASNPVSNNGTGSNTSPTGTANGNGLGTGTGTESGPQPPMSVVEIMPEFPGGVSALMRYLGSNISYPGAAKEEGIEGTVYVSFVVEKDGSVSNVQVPRSLFRPLDNEAMRVVKKMPSWKPGMQNGHTVRVQYTVPIRFTLT